MFLILLSISAWEKKMWYTNCSVRAGEIQVQVFTQQWRLLDDFGTFTLSYSHNDNIGDRICTLYASFPSLCFWDENVVASLCLKGITGNFPYNSHSSPTFSLLYPISASISNSIYPHAIWIFGTDIFYALLYEFLPLQYIFICSFWVLHVKSSDVCRYIWFVPLAMN